MACQRLDHEHPVHSFVALTAYALWK